MQLIAGGGGHIVNCEAHFSVNPQSHRGLLHQPQWEPPRPAAPCMAAEYLKRV